MHKIENQTGALFGDLWPRYGDAEFKHSVELFARRWLANGEPEDFFQGKTCLDVVCGGGRYSLAMALLGAERIVAVDIGEAGLKDAEMRVTAMGFSNVRFQVADALNLPFPSGSFDFVCCSGVLHHTKCIELGLSEIRRILKLGGSAYLLLYGSGGLYWPLNLLMRPFAQHVGYDEVDRCCAAAGFSPAKRRTILDDLFVPLLETYSNERLDCLLKHTGFASWKRWCKGQSDHEADSISLVRELEERTELWVAGSKAAHAKYREIELHLANICRATVEAAKGVVREFQTGHIGEDEARATIVGTGHHLLVAKVPGNLA